MLMELGISPIAMLGMIMQLLAGANLIELVWGSKKIRHCSVVLRNMSGSHIDVFLFPFGFILSV
jgi:hypothetical protein